MNAVAQFIESGYVTLPGMLDAGALAAIDAALHHTGALGARQMLQLDWCAAAVACCISCSARQRCRLGWPGHL